ncbi:MAG: response regulator [Coleofasciculaceae cyanobacterium RL_1_1]|nr:response regulator [Coleofasciculaceae cyanobacterium RL_1_1]
MALAKHDFNQFQPAHILIVDDIHSNRDLLASYLRMTHHRLSFASDGQEAIDHAQNDRPDVILMDLRMPNMDGYEAVKWLKNTPQTQAIPVLFITASVRHNDECDLLKLGEGLLRKPVSQERLFHALEMVLPIAPIAPLSSQQQRQIPDPTPASTAAIAEADSSPPVPYLPLAETDKAQLAQQLQQLAREVWSPLLTVLDIDGLEQFAETLTTLAQTFAYEPLDRYSQTLNQQLDDFDWEKLPQTIANFKRLHDSISPES